MFRNYMTMKKNVYEIQEQKKDESHLDKKKKIYKKILEL